jgi:hypothetical protein
MRQAAAEYRLMFRAAAVAVAALTVLLVGCGSSTSNAGSATSSAASSTASAAASSGGASSSAVSAGSSTASSTTPAGADCGGAVARITAAVSSFTEVTKVQMVAACGQASIETSLPPGVLGSASAATGLKICNAAAAVAYQGDVTSVSVDSADGHELATGLKTAPCIP